MTADTKRAVACVLFGAALTGALATSYLHVAEFFRPVVPAGWPEARYIAALALDVLAAAAGFGLIVAPHARGRGWLHAGLWAAVGLSVWANWRYASAHVPAGGWVADAYVSALLPVLAVIATHAIAAVLAAISPDDAPTTAPAPGPAVTVYRPADDGADARDAARRYVQATGTLPPGYTSGAELARDLGINASQVSRWLTAGRNGRGW